ncbi:S1C family serine protease [Thalassotalea sp. PLHSN55]|uniref:S1C family serine protease n=1 Tax=Thalassotalea sp. PLHSN55 TaxID=3435888 RepID=UPI003F866746
MYRIVRSSLALILLALTITQPVMAENTVQKLFKAVNPGVVELHVKALAEPQPGQVAYKASLARSLGSGALVSEKGRILTAAHVIDRATDIEVIFNDGTKTSGHVVWIDSIIDLAMIQAAKVPSSAKTLKLANKSDYQIGERIVVIGAPYGVSHSLSVGYLSGVRDKEQIPGTTIVPRFLQTDASINQGNSGGPMFNLDGEIIGIVSHILSKTGGSNGLGFVVSIDTIHDVIANEPVSFSGFIPLLLSEKIAYSLNNPFGYGMLIQQVIPGTLAHKLGFRGGNVSITLGRSPVLLGGDIILSIGGHPIKDLEALNKLRKRISEYKKGDEVMFQYLRDGKEKHVVWTIE